MADQVDRRGIVYSPPTFERHDAALSEFAARIVTRDPRKGISRFPGVMPGAWGRLAAGDSITAASGTTLGTGQVKLCSILGVVLIDDPITVANAGPEISAAEDRILALEWTAGVWSTCSCVSTPPVCGEICGSICGGIPFAVPGTVTTGAGSKPIGKAFDELGWAQPPDQVFDTGIDRWVFNRDTTCFEVVGTVKYFFSLYCDGADIRVRIWFNATEFTGVPEGEDPFDVDGCGHFWPNGTLNDGDVDEFKTGLYALAGDVAATVDSCDGASVTLAFDLGAIFTYASDPPLAGTIALAKSSGTPAKACCDPCDIPKTNLVATLGEVTETLVYDETTTTWTGPTVQFGCSGGGLGLSGGQHIWTLDEGESTCSPLHLVFVNEEASVVYVDES